MRTVAVVAVVSVALLAGCTRRAPIRPEAFDLGQRGAILMLQSPPKITIWAAPGATGPELDAAPVLAELRPVVVEAMGKSQHFGLVAEAKVFAAPAYKGYVAPPDPSGYISAPGYKAVKDESVYPQIAREAGADMGIGIALNLLYRAEDGAAAVVVSVGAIDTKGRGIWKGGAAEFSDRPIDVRTATLARRIEAYRDAARKAMVQLEENLSSHISVEGAERRSGR